jgi:mRNA-degrading endonuclease YafQ of YafQ-DinJ toxin-antitoxin module
VISAIWDEAFKRSYRKRIKKDEERRRRFWRRMDLFLASPFSPQLRTHKLSGKLEGRWAFSVDDDVESCLSLLGKTRSSSSTLEVMMRSIRRCGSEACPAARELFGSRRLAGL